MLTKVEILVLHSVEIEHNYYHTLKFFRDIPGLAYKLGTEEIFIDADLKSSTPGGPIGGQSRVKLRNDHFSYLLTWFGLSACTLFMWCQKYIPK